MIIDENNLTRSIFKLALPAVIENTLMMIVGFVSTLLVGRLGKEALSAAGMCNSTINFIMVLFVALSTGSTILVARFTGAKKHRLARETTRQSIVIGGALSLLLTLPCSIFARQIIGLFFASANVTVKEDAILYFSIVSLSLPFILINAVVGGCLRGIGDTKTPLYIASGVNVVNVLLSIILIYGIPFLNVSGMGFKGAAIGVTISRAVGGVACLFIITYKNNILRSNLLKKFKVRWKILYKLYNFGFPATLEQGIMQGGFFMMQIVLSMMGTLPMAIFSIVNTINSVAYIPTWGFGAAATTLIGQSLGQRRADLAERAGWTTGHLSLAFNVVLTIILFTFAKPLILIFNDDPEV